jgi:hypothetical protein
MVTRHEQVRFILSYLARISVIFQIAIGQVFNKRLSEDARHEWAKRLQDLRLRRDKALSLLTTEERANL